MAVERGAIVADEGSKGGAGGGFSTSTRSVRLFVGAAEEVGESAAEGEGCENGRVDE